MPTVFKPSKYGEVKTNVSYTKSDRQRDAETYRERKAEQEKMKEERFAKIKEKRKAVRRSGGNSRGINIEVTSDK